MGQGRAIRRNLAIAGRDPELTGGGIENMEGCTPGGDNLGSGTDDALQEFVQLHRGAEGLAHFEEHRVALPHRRPHRDVPSLPAQEQGRQAHRQANRLAEPARGRGCHHRQRGRDKGLRHYNRKPFISAFLCSIVIVCV